MLTKQEMIAKTKSLKNEIQTERNNSPNLREFATYLNFEIAREHCHNYQGKLQGEIDSIIGDFKSGNFKK